MSGSTCLESQQVGGFLSVGLAAGHGNLAMAKGLQEEVLSAQTQGRGLCGSCLFLQIYSLHAFTLLSVWDGIKGPLCPLAYGCLLPMEAVTEDQIRGRRGVRKESEEA